MALTQQPSSTMIVSGARVSHGLPALYQLVSWWEMEQFSAAEFFGIAQSLTSIKEEFSRSPEAKVKRYEATEKTDQWMKDMVDKCIKAGLSVSAHLINNKRMWVKHGLATLGEFANEIDHIAESIRTEMYLRKFMHLPPDQAKWYDQQEMFGADVNARFPGIQFDMVEAGNCYAVGRATACVFHLMRIMETGVQEFGRKLGVLLVSEKNWQNILDEINKAIKALPKGPATTEMSQASANLYAVKLAWRNEVMHPKDTYTLEEADNLLRQVRLFMQGLAKIVT